MKLRLELIDHAASTWPAELAALWRDLGAPHNLELLPEHFVQTTFVKMGGLVLRLLDGDTLIGVGLLFPRWLERGKPLYTLRVSLGSRGLDNRYSSLDGGIIPALESEIRSLLPHSRLQIPNLRAYAATHQQIGGFDIGAPGETELEAIRALHAAIWGSAPGAQYPDDLYSAGFGSATSLVARAEGRLVGFLLGFYRFGGLDGLERAGFGTALSIESQVMGVDPGLRRAGLAATLKRAQAAEALACGIGVIHWTADPLQFANATLNFHKLRAVAGEFYPAYYPFQNELNRVPASRLGVAWLPATAWGRVGLADGPRRDRSLSRFAGCVVLNDGPRALRGPGGAPHIAVEIPADWTALQRDELEVAAGWREATDAILAEWLGFAPSRYLIADVAIEGERRYLVGHDVEMMRDAW